MCSRSLTEVFVLMRNNAMQSRHIYSEQRISDRVALVDNADDDVELGKIPPAWTSAVEEAQYTIVRLKSKLVMLTEVQSKVILRPTLDDSTEDEQQIDLLSHEISRMFNSSHRLIGQIKGEVSGSKSAKEVRLAECVVSALIMDLQELYQEFRNSQANYLNKVNSREERSRAYFEVDLTPAGEGSSMSTALEDLDWLGSRSNGTSLAAQDDGYTGEGDLQKLAEMEGRTARWEVREKEVRGIVESIAQLGDMFRELSNMVVHQGTILDRIDYNIECAQVQVAQGTKQLQKAASYQKGSRKMMCIIILASVTTVLAALLIITKAPSH